MAKRSSARVAVAFAGWLAALAPAAALALTWPFSRGQGYLDAIALLALVAFAFAAEGRSPGAIAWGLGLIAAEFAFRVQLEPATAEAAPFVAAGMLLAAQLINWSYELERLTSGPAVLGRRVLLEIGLAAAAGALVAAAEIAIGLLPAVGEAFTLLGAAAVVATVAVVVYFLRRPALAP